MILHATRKLFEKIPLDEHGQLAATPKTHWMFEQPPLENNPLGGWNANLLARQQNLWTNSGSGKFPSS